MRGAQVRRSCKPNAAKVIGPSGECFLLSILNVQLVSRKVNFNVWKIVKGSAALLLIS